MHYLSFLMIIRRRIRLIRQTENWIDAKTFGANRLKFTPDGRPVLVSSLGDGDLASYDAASPKEFKWMQKGDASGILMDPVGHRALIACTPSALMEIPKLSPVLG